jgi:hypothetical protein
MNKYLTKIVFTEIDRDKEPIHDYQEQQVEFEAEDDHKALEMLLEVITDMRKRFANSTLPTRVTADGLYVCKPVDISKYTNNEIELLSYLTSGNTAYLRHWDIRSLNEV